MNENDIEQLLKRYVPRGPQPELRTRIIQRSRVVRLWPLAIAASLLLVATVALQMMSDRIATTIIAPGPDPVRLVVDNLTEMLGGDEVARRYAEAAIARDRSRPEAVSVPPTEESEVR